MRTLLASIFAVALSATANAASPVETLAEELASELSRLCPPAQPGDQAAASHNLAYSSAARGEDG